MNLYKSILPVDERGFYGEFGGSGYGDGVHLFQ